MSVELDLLDTVIDESDMYKQTPSREELESVNVIVYKYIKENGLMLYGGTAIDTVLKDKTGEGIYGPNKLPDYDFISSNNVKDAMTIANILTEKGYEYVAVNQAQHGNTLRVKVNFAPEASADITYYPPDVFSKVPYVEIDGVKYVSPEYMRIDFYKSFTNPNNYYRWLEKDEYMRYRKVVDAFPLDPHPMDYEWLPAELDARAKEVVGLLSAYCGNLIWTGVVAFNRYTKVMGTEPVPINYMEAYIDNPVETLNDLMSHLGDDYDVEVYSKLLDHYPTIYMLRYKGSPVLGLFNSSDIRFISTVKMGDEMYVSIHQLLLFLHIKVLQAKVLGDDYYESLARNLLYRLNHEREAYLDKHNMVGIEKDSPLSIFNFDYDNLPISEARERAIENFYKRVSSFKYYPGSMGLQDSINDYEYPELDGKPEKVNFNETNDQ